ncbi:hypothetical protein EHQ53_04545 [Leptospira langatensis]|uniref:Uncharacterized protein n=1 Tax=Leptospira langatensis TaxID=2484983 RepID=A0A5F1ZY57_9LEPT|nr:hypothetical protein [Leptospira langatensis]TGK00092.1 hypothetical protein EHO57_12410 [Leptospira langatensis]TGL42726.1 hypothetical protein EHQ53_04545 [Leptospira langatensis]
MADDFTIEEGEGFPAGSGDDFDPSEMSLDEIDSLLSPEGGDSDFNFESLPEDSVDTAGFEELLASSGDAYPEDVPNFEPEETDFGSDLSQLDESVHLDEDFDFDLTDPLIDAEIDRLLDIDDDITAPSSPSSSGAPSWKGEAPASQDLDEHEDAFGDLGALDLGDFSQPGEVPSSAFHSEDKPFEWGGEEEHDEVVGLADMEMDESPISLSDDELHNIDIAADLADFSMDEEETSTTDEPSARTTHEDDIISDDEGPISLSEHELDDIMAEDFSPSISEDGLGELEDTDFATPSSEVTGDLDFEEEEKDIALSTDELDHLLEGDASEAKDSFTEMGDFGDLDLGSVSGEETPPSTFSDLEEENEPIALSDDELGNLLSSSPEEEASSVNLDDLSVSDSPFEEATEIDFGKSDDDGELDLADFDFDPDSEEADTDEFIADEEESISLPISDFEDMGISESANPLDGGLDLGDFEEPSLGKEDVALESLGDFTSASDEDLLGTSNEEEITELPELRSDDDDFLSEEADEAIALSDDELGNLLSSGTEEEAPMDASSEIETLDSDFLGEGDSEENEPIALSDDELGNLLSSEEEEGVPTFDSVLDEEEEQEPIALSNDELGDLLSSGEEESSFDGMNFEPEEDASRESAVEFGDFSLDSEADEPIALSEDELGNLLSDEAEEIEGDTSLDLEDDSDEPISLPISELEETASAAEQVAGDYDIDWDGPVADLNDLSTSEPAAPSDWDLGEEADEPITLSNDELGNLLADDATPEMEEGELDALLSSSPEGSDLDALGSLDGDLPIADMSFAGDNGGEIIPTIERIPQEEELNFILDEYADDEELSPLEEIRQGGFTQTVEGEEGAPTQDEMKRILLYLDELLGNLPDDMIRDFSRSDYFELYKKLMKQIGV